MSAAVTSESIQAYQTHQQIIAAADAALIKNLERYGYTVSPESYQKWDGDCWYKSIEFNLKDQLPVPITAEALRAGTIAYIRSHYDDYKVALISSPDNRLPMTKKQFEDDCDYLAKPNNWITLRGFVDQFVPEATAKAFDILVTSWRADQSQPARFGEDTAKYRATVGYLITENGEHYHAVVKLPTQSDPGYLEVAVTSSPTIDEPMTVYDSQQSSKQLLEHIGSASSPLFGSPLPDEFDSLGTDVMNYLDAATAGPPSIQSLYQTAIPINVIETTAAVPTTQSFGKNTSPIRVIDTAAFQPIDQIVSRSPAPDTFTVNPIEQPQCRADLEQVLSSDFAEVVSTITDPEVRQYLISKAVLFKVEGGKLAASEYLLTHPDRLYDLFSAPEPTFLLVQNAFRKKTKRMINEVRTTLANRILAVQDQSTVNVSDLDRECFQEYVKTLSSSKPPRAAPPKPTVTMPPTQHSIVTAASPVNPNTAQPSPSVIPPTGRQQVDSSPPVSATFRLRWPIQVVLEFRSFPNVPTVTVTCFNSISDLRLFANSLLRKMDLVLGQSPTDFDWSYFRANQWTILPHSEIFRFNPQSRQWLLQIFNVERLSTPKQTGFRGPKQRLERLYETPWKREYREAEEIFRALYAPSHTHQLHVSSLRQADGVLRDIDLMLTMQNSDITINVIADLTDVIDPFTWFSIRQHHQVILQTTVSSREGVLQILLDAKQPIQNQHEARSDIRINQRRQSPPRYAPTIPNPYEAMYVDPVDEPVPYRPGTPLHHQPHNHPREQPRFQVQSNFANYDPRNIHHTENYKKLINERDKGDIILPRYGITWLLQDSWEHNIQPSDTHPLRPPPCPASVLPQEHDHLFQHLADKGSLFRHEEMWTIPDVEHLSYLIRYCGTGTFEFGRFEYTANTPTPAELSVFPELPDNTVFLDTGSWFNPVLNFGILSHCSPSFIDNLLDEAAHPQPPGIGGLGETIHPRERPSILCQKIRQALNKPLHQLTAQNCGRLFLQRHTWFTTQYKSQRTITAASPTVQHRRLILVCLNHPNKQPSLALLQLPTNHIHRPPFFVNFYTLFNLMSKHYSRRTYTLHKIKIHSDSEKLAPLITSVIPYDPAMLCTE